MSVEPYKSARRVFWIVDNGSSHAGKPSIARMQATYERATGSISPSTPLGLTRSSCTSSIVQRKALTSTTSPRSTRSHSGF
ncbi:MAG: hypothetical protein R2736_06530 [Solirubrobacterales bacterium]